jgi:LacI family transcriptional regulator
LNIAGPGRRAPVHDVARQAGVSLATVDRVLNGRPGVRQQTIARVEAAIAALGFSRNLSASLLARAAALKAQFLIPDGDNVFMETLAAAIVARGRAAAGERLDVGLERYRALDPSSLSQAIDRLDKASCDCAVIVAADHPQIAAAAEAAMRRGIAIVTLVSDLPASSRKLFIGIDNVAAGRTAASLIGRFCPQGGKVGLIVGSLALSDHRDRAAGFIAIAAAEYPGLSVIGPFEGHDDDAETGRLVAGLLASHPDLCALYNVGAGNHGLIGALGDHRPRVVLHELGPESRDGLRGGVVDVVLDQDPDGEVREAIAAARALAAGAPYHPASIEIGIFLRDNLR